MDTNNTTHEKPTGYELWLMRMAADPKFLLKRHKRIVADGVELTYLSLTSCSGDIDSTRFFAVRRVALSRLLGPGRRWLKTEERKRVGTASGGDEEVTARLVLTETGRMVLESAIGRRAAKPGDVYFSTAEVITALNERRLSRNEQGGMGSTTWFAPAPSSSEARPSEVYNQYWVHSSQKNSSYPQTTSTGGKWMIFVPVAELDEAWEKVKAALAEGRLGNRAKCSTAMPNPNASDPNTKVIIVYTYDGDDEDDVWRVRQGLRDIGFTGTLYWKGDSATRAGQYVVRGSRGVSRYRG